MKILNLLKKHYHRYDGIFYKRTFEKMYVKIFFRILMTITVIYAVNALKESNVLEAFR
ncbi:hypothetical protein TEHD23766T_2007 [Tetragenococcus halophilus subsp. flandriensis]|nr:hypothetical protein TEHD23766T_2007 [Tetragenococcus halophilus subsp. flandriensis]